MAKYLAVPSLAPNKRPDEMVDRSRPIERYEIYVRSFANHTFASTLTGVAIFSDMSAILPGCSARNSLLGTLTLIVGSFIE